MTITEESNDIVSLDDFKRLNIRIGEIISVEKVDNADKLLKLMVDFGSEKRQIMSAIAPYFEDPQTLISQQLPFLLNIEPRTFRGHESQGMLIAAHADDKPVLLHPATKVPLGSRLT